MPDANRCGSWNIPETPDKRPHSHAKATPSRESEPMARKTKRKSSGAAARTTKRTPARKAASAARQRSGAVKRVTKETAIEVSVNLDGTGQSSVSTGIGFFDHMLDQLARHSRIDIAVKAKGDLHIDHHHTTRMSASRSVRP